MLKCNPKIRSDTRSNVKSLAPLKVSYERFLYNSVMAFFGTDILSPKNIQIAQGNRRETNP